MSEKPTKTDPATGETLYPCNDCDTMRTKAEGGTTFTVCEMCWDRRHPRAAPTADLWGPTIPCGDCKAEVRWEQLDMHWCSEQQQRIDQEIAAVEAHLKQLCTFRDRKRAVAASA
jgi:hypothetical protein